MHHGSLSGHSSLYLFEELEGSVSPHPWCDELDGATLLEDSGAVSELAGATAELSGAASELLDSTRDESASCTELLTGSWLSGMSTIWLELAGPAVSLELFRVASLELLVVSGESLEAGGIMSSGGISPPRGSSLLAEEVSSQALRANDAANPSDAAIALLAASDSFLFWEIFFFSIFMSFLL